MEYKIEAMVLAATNMDKMVDFYTNVFGIEFEEEATEDGNFYNGKWAEFDFTLIPTELSDVKDGQNPMHYDIFVPDLEKSIELVEKHNGKTNEQLGEDDTLKAIGIFDPDENFMVFKQRK
ncbi:MAG: hypothetical protein COA79_02955 [Planctomycetota bacterium]|nr:MAG: hypothetical protein COA79_02955 [Planctomycetota bacterium]